MRSTVGSDAGRSGAVRVLVVDDHPLVRASVRALLDPTSDLEVVGEACDGAQAVGLDALLRPDVVVMDLSMPGMDGAEATRRLTLRRPEVQVLVLTASTGGDRVQDALGAGAIGYLLKDAEPERLVEGVRAVVRGESPLDPRAVRAMLERTRPGARRGLTSRQLDVLRCVRAGMTNREIAAALGISPRTVKVHVGAVLQCLGVRDRRSAARWAGEPSRSDVA